VVHELKVSGTVRKSQLVATARKVLEVFVLRIGE
jgi:hypothetical protein